MRKLKFVLMILVLAVAVAACGDDDDPDNNGTTNNGTVDAGDTGGDATLGCDESQEPTCCDSNLQEVDATCNEDTSEWECPEGATEFPVGGVCEQTDAGDTGGGDTADGA